MNDHTVWKLNKQMQAAEALRSALGASSNPEDRPFDDSGVDEDLIRDMVEGETDLHEMIGKTVASMDEDSVLMEGLKKVADDLTQRLTRIKKRHATKRAAIEQAMTIGELKSLEMPTVTITLKRTAPGLQIVDESLIPADWWAPQDPKLDKRGLLKALKDEAEIPGAQLDNGGVSLQMRRN